MHLKFLEKQEQVKLKISKWKEIIKIKAEIKEMKTKKQCKVTRKQIRLMNL
jgi:hypothetical protein